MYPERSPFFRVLSRISLRSVIPFVGSLDVVVGRRRYFDSNSDHSGARRARRGCLVFPGNSSDGFLSMGLEDFVDEVRVIVDQLPIEDQNQFGLPVAYVVDNEVATFGDSVEVLTEEEAVALAELSHLFVKFGDVESGSLVDRYPAMIAADYPAELVDGSATSQTPFSFENIANEFLLWKFGQEIDNGIDLEEDGFLELSHRISEAIGLLASTYRELFEGPLAWQVYWMRHVDEGLSSLSKLLRNDQAEQDDLRFQIYLRSVYPAFGLPNPEAGDRYKNGHLLHRAMTHYWSDSEVISASLRALTQLRKQSGGELVNGRHPLAEVPWVEIDQLRTDRMQANENSLLAFFLHQKKQQGALLAISRTTEDEFFSPTVENSRGIVISRDSEILVAEEVSAELFFLSKTRVVTDATGSRKLQTEELAVDIACLHLEAHLNDEVLKSQIKIVNLDGGVNSRIYFVPSGRPGLFSNCVRIFGRFEKEIAGSGPFSYHPRILTLSIEIPQNDVLEDHIPPNISTKVILLPPDGMGAVVVEGRSGLKKPQIYCGREFDQDGSFSGDIVGGEYLDGQILRLAIWLSDSTSKVEIDDVVQPISSRNPVGIAAQIICKPDEHVIESEGHQITLLVQNLPQIDSGGVDSPIEACIEDCELDPVLRSSIDQEDLRAAVEDFYFEIFTDEQRWEQFCGSLFHIVATEDQQESLVNVKLAQSEDVLISSELLNRGVWPFQVGQEVPQSFLLSAEVKIFLEKYSQLNLGEFLMDNKDRGGPGWLSKVEIGSGNGKFDDEAIRRVFEENLAEMLYAYRKLILAANSSGSDIAKFWVRYPFSVSVWQSRSERDCSAVLMSPFHPLRLSWMYSVQKTLRSAKSNSGRQTRKRALAGAISGWNIPLVSQRQNRFSGLLAAAMDNGPMGLFAGWSMMLKAATDSPKQQTGPVRAADYAFPGVEANGLDITATKGALRDFHVANPFMTTVVIDLAANIRSAKSSGVDQAVAGEVKHWAESRGEIGAAGVGVKVFDSLNRVGPIVEELDVSQFADTAVTWQRYEESNAPRNANIKIINDSSLGLSIRPGATQADAFGVLASVPLRRYEIPEQVASGQVNYLSSAGLSFGMDHDSESVMDMNQEFQALLGIFERHFFNTDTPIQVEMSVGSLDRNLGDADWVVAGENGISPAAVVSILSNHARADSTDARMMWDWRPPFLDISSSKGTIDRKPYLAIARLPKVFIARMNRVLSALLERPSTTEDASNLLASLGSRGMGLASMTRANNKHETHQKGAIGFSLVFDLMDRLPTEANDRFVIPIDVCDAFLSLLAGNDASSRNQLADLVLFELRDDELVIVPIEIKLYALENPTARLPQHNSVAMNKPKNQATATSRRLIDISDAWVHAQKSASSSKLLLANAVGALLESAMKLTPRAPLDRGLTARRLGALLNGEIRLTVGKSLIAYLEATSSEEKCLVNVSPKRPVDDRDHVVFAADPRSVAAELAEGGEEIVKKWKRAVELSVGASIPPVVEVPKNDENGDSSSDRSDLSTEAGDLAITEIEATEPSIPNEEHLSEEYEIDPLEVGDLRPPGVRFKVGTSNDGVEVDFWPGNTSLNSLNVGIVGDMGTGKTQFCSTLIHQLRWSSRQSQPAPVTGLILDYKGDYKRPEFLESVGGILLDPVNIPLDIFGVRGEKTMKAMNRRARIFIDILSKIFSGLGNVQTENLTQVIIEQIQSNDSAPTMVDIANAYSAKVGHKIDAVVNILNNFVRNEVFGEDARDFKSLEELLENNVIVLDLKQLDPDIETKNSLVALFLNFYMEYMTGLKKWPFEGEDPQLRRLNSFLLVDEATNIMEYKFDVLRQILLQGREYGVSVLLSSQYLNHFDVTEMDYAETLRTWFIHKVPSVSKSKLQKLGISESTDLTAQLIPRLENHHFLYSSMGNSCEVVQGLPFFKLMQNADGSQQKW
jgi:DNA phosphorothioation-dependent restriction protein DptH